MAFDYQPTLAGDLVSLRPLQPDDYDDLYAVARDPLIWEQHPKSDRYQEPVFKTLFQDALDSGGALIVIDQQTQKIIGSTRYHGYDPSKSEVEIGWTFLARSHWGGKYNGDMKRIMLEHAFLFVKHVVLMVAPRNLRSMRAVEKIGGTRRAMRPDATGTTSYEYVVTSGHLG